MVKREGTMHNVCRKSAIPRTPCQAAEVRGRGQEMWTSRGCQEKGCPTGEGLLAGDWRVRGCRGQDESQYRS